VTSLLTALLAPPLAAQPTVYVPDDYPTIQGAIDAASDGWTILVRPGRYVENTDYLGKAITVESTDGPEVTIIDGSLPADPDLGSVVMFVSEEDQDSILDGFTLTGGSGSRWRDPQGYWRRGGGAVFIYSCDPTIRRCILEGNSGIYGGGIYASYAYFTVVESCTIRNNVASTYGGGIHSEPSRISIVDCVIEGNTAGAGGGAFFWESRTVRIQSTRFSGNTATYGGAICAIDESFIDFLQCRFESNQAEYGGAVFSNHWDYYEDCHFRFDSCLFVDNAAGIMGGAIFGNTFGQLGHLFIRGSTFVGNTAAEGAACWLEVHNRHFSRISSSIIMGSGREPIKGIVDPEIVTSCLIEGGLFGQANLNPLLLEPASGDHRLAAGSFCVDSGSSGEPGHHPPLHGFDLDGNPRIVDGDRDGTSTIDMGCYEYQPRPFDARVGSVNTGEAGVNRADVLLLNGSPGDAERVVTVGTGESLQLDIAAPPSRPGPAESRYVIYAWVGEPDPLAVSVQERFGFFVGWTAFPTVFSGGSPLPIKLWSTFGHEPILGDPDFLSDKAPATLFSLPNGRPAPITATFQGFIEDDAAPNDFRVATTNAVVMRVE
jgi:predicted outer membrane repeat protein